MTTTLRPFVQTDLVPAQALTASFGWPHRLEDWAFMVRHGNGIVADQDGTLVGTGMAWCFGRRFAALGLVGVQQGQQGRGLGRRLMQALLEELGDRTVILHATEAGAPLYESFGFEAETLIRQYQGIATPGRLVRLPDAQRLRPIGRADHVTLIGLDTAATGLPRDALLTDLLEDPDGVLLDAGEDAAGFALLRRFGRGMLIGPAAARDTLGAQALIGHLLGRQAGQFVRVDVPEGGGLGPWLMEFGLADAGPGLRMVRGPRPCAGQGGLAMQAMLSQALG